MRLESVLIVDSAGHPTTVNADNQRKKTSILNKGIINRPSKHSVEETVERIKSILQTKGATFALVDRSGEAGKAPFRFEGIALPPLC
jgi:hypothetical protein